MCGTILMAVARHPSLGSIGAKPLHMCIEVHVLTAVLSVPLLNRANYIARVGKPNTLSHTCWPYEHHIMATQVTAEGQFFEKLHPAGHSMVPS